VQIQWYQNNREKNKTKKRSIKIFKIAICLEILKICFISAKIQGGGGGGRDLCRPGHALGITR